MGIDMVSDLSSIPIDLLIVIIRLPVFGTKHMNVR